MAAAEAAIWRARAESGVMYINATRILAPNRDDLWGEVHKWESLAAKEPSRGNAAAAISALRMLGCRRYSQCAPIVLHALASGKVTWQSDNSVSVPASLEGDPPRPPQPSQDLHVGTTVQPPQPLQPSQEPA